MSTKSKKHLKEAIEGYLFISPWLIGFAIFTAGAVGASFVMSLTNWSIFGSPKYIGFENYKTMINDKFFWQSLKVTSIYLLNIPLNLIIGLLLAILLNQKIRGLSIYRTIYYLPSVVSGVAVSILWMWIFNPRFGLVNTLLSYIGIQGPAWLADERWALPALIIMSIWGVGGSMLIYLGALQGIPTQLYEAATLDGAGIWHRFRHVTLPMVTPVMLLNLIMGVINSFQTFTQPFVMTNGGPNYATLFYVLYLYQQGFEWFNMGYAAALAWVLFLIILICTIIIIKTSAAWVYYETE